MIDSVGVLILCSVFCAHAVNKHCHEETGRCYWISDTAQGTFLQGRTACQSEGGDLAVMETEELFDFVVTKFRLVILRNSINGIFCNRINKFVFQYG